MDSYQANPLTERRARRPWIIEMLIVLGVLAFGYFAVAFDSGLAPSANTSETIDPFADFVR